MFKTQGIKGFFDKLFEVKTDGQSVWVDHGGKCVARFSEAGVGVGVPDIPNNVFNRSKAPMGSHEWVQFRRLMHDCYGFSLGEEWRPEWLVKPSVTPVTDSGMHTSQQL